MKMGVPRRCVWPVAPLREVLAGREAEPPDSSPHCLKIPHSPSAQRRTEPPKSLFSIKDTLQVSHLFCRRSP